jgi:ATP-dependent RNA helicase UAP56/SUB2
MVALRSCAKRATLDISKAKHFVLDECDRMIGEIDMLRQVQAVITDQIHPSREAGHDANRHTQQRNIRPICKKCCQDVMEVEGSHKHID